MRLVAGWALALAVIMTGLSLRALYNRHRAEKNRGLAESATEIANRERGIAEKNERENRRRLFDETVRRGTNRSIT